MLANISCEQRFGYCTNAKTCFNVQYILVKYHAQYSANINRGIHAILAERRVLLG